MTAQKNRADIASARGFTISPGSFVVLRQIFWLVAQSTRRVFPCCFVMSLQHSDLVRLSSPLTAAGPPRNLTGFPEEGFASLPDPFGSSEKLFSSANCITTEVNGPQGSANLQPGKGQKHPWADGTVLDKVVLKYKEFETWPKNIERGIERSCVVRASHTAEFSISTVSIEIDLF